MSKYLQLDFTGTQMYEYSKEEKDGFTKHTSSKDKVSYRKTYREGVYGTLMDVSLRDTNIGKMIGVALKDLEGDFVYLQFPFLSQRGDVDNRFAEPIIRMLGNLKTGNPYRFFPYKLDSESQKDFDTKTEGRTVRDKYYDRYGVSIKNANIEDRKVTSAIDAALVYKGSGDNVIPSLDWQADITDPEGSKTPTAISKEAKNNFLKLALMNAINGHLKREDTGDNNPIVEQKPKQEPTPKDKSSDVEDDDLPF